MEDVRQVQLQHQRRLDLSKRETVSVVSGTCGEVSLISSDTFNSSVLKPRFLTVLCLRCRQTFHSFDLLEVQRTKCLSKPPGTLRGGLGLGLKSATPSISIFSNFSLSK